VPQRLLEIDLLAGKAVVPLFEPFCDHRDLRSSDLRDWTSKILFVECMAVALLGAAPSLLNFGAYFAL
jgi:hypothetical protein